MDRSFFATLCAIFVLGAVGSRPSSTVTVSNGWYQEEISRLTNEVIELRQALQRCENAQSAVEPRFRASKSERKHGYRHRIARRRETGHCSAGGVKTTLQFKPTETTNLTEALGSLLPCHTTLKSLKINGHFTGTMPASITTLTALTYLQVERTRISGNARDWPPFSPSLRILKVKSNGRLQGQIPDNISALTKLETLEIVHSGFSGPLPGGLFEMTSLQRLTLIDTLKSSRLNGSISEGLSKLTKLKKIWMQNTEISGAIPDGLSALAQLNSLVMQNNQFTGPVPVAISSLTELTRLILSDNTLSGSIPQALQDILQRVKEIDMSNNRLYGQIPKVVLNVKVHNESDKCYERCQGLLGPCPLFCGIGFCCRVGRQGRGCDGTIGGKDAVRCVKPPLLAVLLPQTCPRGMQAEPGSDNSTFLRGCRNCDVGKYCIGGLKKSDFDAYECPPGTFQNMPGASKVGDCKPCPPGHRCPAGSSESAPCEAGTFAPGGFEVCTKCPPGFYSNTTSEHCSLCETGHRCPHEGTTFESMTTEGNQCPPGSFAFQGRAECTECAPGSYSNHSAKGQCSDCPPGYYCPKGTSLPHHCPKGTHRYNSRGSSKGDCTICPMGTFSSETGSSTCLDCKEGFSSESSATSSSNCTKALLVEPEAISSDLSPDSLTDTSKHVTIINTGVRPISWRFVPGSALLTSWARATVPNGTTAPGGVSTVPIHISFGPEDATNETDRYLKNVSLLQVGSEHVNITTQLLRRTGAFVVDHSSIEGGSHRQTIVSRTVEWTLRTRDVYWQNRHEVAGESIQLNMTQVNGNSSEIISSIMCVVAQACRSNEDLCCHANQDGTYKLQFTPKNPGQYRLEAFSDARKIRFEGSSTRTFAKITVSHGLMCGKLDISQQNSLAARKANAKLRIEVDLQEKQTAQTEIIFSRVNSTKELNGSVTNGKWSGISTELSLGSWQVEYRSGNEVCATKTLDPVGCMTGYRQAEQKCIPLVTDKSGARNFIGAAIGAMMVLSLCFLIFYARKHRDKFKKLFVSFLHNEVKLAATFGLELWDFVGDAYLFSEVMNSKGETKEKMGNVVMALWVIFFCLAILVSLFGLALKVKVAIVIMRRRRLELSEVDRLDEYTAKHTTKLGKVRKSLFEHYAAIAAGLLEDLPMGVLGLVYLHVQMSEKKNVGLVLLLSIASSFLSLGIKLSKFPNLRYLFDDEKKYKRKVSRVQLNGADVATTWLQRIEPLKKYATLFEAAGLGNSADKLIAMSEDAPLIAIGMDSEVDRKYLLLQVARVRQHNSFCIDLTDKEPQDPTANVRRTSVAATAVIAPHESTRTLLGSIEMQRMECDAQIVLDSTTSK